MAYLRLPRTSSSSMLCATRCDSFAGVTEWVEGAGGCVTSVPSPERFHAHQGPWRLTARRLWNESFISAPPVDRVKDRPRQDRSRWQYVLRPGALRPKATFWQDTSARSSHTEWLHV